MLDEQLVQFQAEIERLAFAAARSIIEQELAHRRAKAEPTRPRKGRLAPPARPTRRQLELGLGQVPKRQLDLPLAQQRAAAEAAQAAGPPDATARAAEPAGAPDAAATPATGTATPEPSPGAAAGGRGRTRWTRETITTELATWLLSGTAIDAQFMTRHGPKGLVAAIRRVFGRFEAALNVAALHNAKLYPEGPPTRGGGAGRPAALAAPPQEPK
ncbi:MAG TPA: hypothetical protein VHW23_32890 [Kofleriaceae bacterium]|nr:hypothetical protein [Kofleriaceae bacterium]